MRELILAIAAAAVSASLYFLSAKDSKSGQLWALAGGAGFAAIALYEIARMVRHWREFERLWSKLTADEQLLVCELFKLDGPHTDGEISHSLGRPVSENLLQSAYKKTRLLLKHDYQGTYEVDPIWKRNVGHKAKRTKQ
jgi:hypothetical protein